MTYVIPARTRFSPFAFVILGGLLLSSNGCKPKHDQTGPTPAPRPISGFVAVSCGSEPASPARSIPLAPGKARREHLRPGEFHSYSINLATGNLFQATAEQSEADLVLCLYDSSGRLIVALDSPNGRDEPEEILWSVRKPGTYRLVIHSLNRGEDLRAYSLSSRLIRPPTDRDLERLTGVNTAAAAEELRRSADPAVWPTARKKYLQSLRSWEKLGDQHRQADIQVRLGRLDRERLRNPERALLYYRLAHAIFVRLGEWKQDARVLAILGKIAMDLGHLEEALGFQQQGLSLFEMLGDRRAQAVALNEIGLLYELLGQMHRALDSYSRSREIWSRLEEPAGKAVALHNRGYLYSSLGAYQEALDDWQAARDLEAGGASDPSATLTLIGTTYTLLGQPQRALPLLSQALSWRIAHQDRRGEAATLNSLGFAFRRLGRLKDAVANQRRALEIFETAGDARDRARALHNYGIALKDVGRSREASSVLETAIDRGRRCGDEQLVEASLFGLAQVKRSQGDLPAALALIQESLRSIEEFRLRPPWQNLRATYFATVQDYYDFAVELLMELESRTPHRGYSVEAFNVSERSRARSLLDLLQASGVELRERVPATLVEAKRRLENAIREKNRLLIQHELGGLPIGRNAESELRELLRDHDRLTAEIRLASPNYQALTRAQPLTAQQIQRQVLDSNTLLLHYELGTQRSYLWVVAPDSVLHFTLPARDVIERFADRAYKLLANPEEPASQAQTEITLRRLSDLLLGQVWNQLGKRRLLIAGEGALQYVPFAALPQPMREADGRLRPLVVDHEVVTVPSASTLAMLKSQQSGRKPAPKRIAVIADPVFSADDRRIQLRHSLKSGPSTPSLRDHPIYSRLRYSRLEAQAISTLVPAGEMLKALDFAANRRLVLSGILQNYQIIHFATHGEIDSNHPELSRLILSLVDEKGRQQDGFLYGQEIFGLRIPAELVVLSACKTGMGQEIRGEGLVGLPQAFLYAGAARVVVSLWNVEDRGTSLLFKSFYHHLLVDERTPSEALRMAQIERWRARPWSHHWAAFVIQGRWR